MLDLDKNESLTNAQYHERSEVSKSDIDLLLKSPLHFLQKEFKEQTPNMLLGSVTHKLILEPDDFTNEFVIEPSVNKRTKAGKEELEAFYSTLNGKTPISEELYNNARAMSEEVLKLHQTGLFLKNGKSEQSYFGQLEGVACKCRPDFYNEELGLLVDIKTSQDASKNGFAKAVANFNYHIQAAFYSDLMRSLGHKVEKFLFIVVESKAPHHIGFYTLDEMAIELGQRTYKEMLELYKWCKANNNWFGYSEFEGQEINPIQTISLPAWKFYEEI